MFKCPLADEKFASKNVYKFKFQVPFTGWIAHFSIHDEQSQLESETIEEE